MSSLSLLNPAPGKMPIVKHTTKTDIQLYVEGLLNHLVRLVSSGQLDHPDLQKHIAPDFTVHIEYMTSPIVTSRDGVLQIYRSRSVHSPAYLGQIISLDSEIEETNETVTVSMVSRLPGEPASVGRETVTICRFRKIHGTWMYTRQDGLRGVLGAGSTGMMKQNTKTDIQRYLEQLMDRLLHLICSDQSHPDVQNHIADKFTAYIDHAPTPYVTSRDAFLQIYGSKVAACPSYAIESLSAQCQLDKKMEVGSVIQVLRITGDPEGVVRGSIATTRFQKVDGLWVGYRQDAIRGVFGMGDAGF